ncbi:MAG: Cys-Xaa-Xaa-Xaa repeat radical SAM target protein [Muribaculaceae bacterium]|nr:Cys-Xaa-Xaa-Xaa repeat radical SAM target protein [Muribaculaceae bacterium]
MKNKANNEELQSRRQFFKRAAKGVLPILGAVVLSSMPLISNATESCNCYGTCYGTCYGGCQGSCGTTCSGKCIGSCSGTCQTSCYRANR